MSSFGGRISRMSIVDLEVDQGSDIELHIRQGSDVDVYVLQDSGIDSYTYPADLRTRAEEVILTRAGLILKTRARDSCGIEMESPITTAISEDSVIP